jgi:hypothetical protein
MFNSRRCQVRRFIPSPLKYGTVFSSTWTVSWVRGLRPIRALRRLIVKAPNPRSSTRSPRARAAVIWSKIVATCEHGRP